MFPRKFDKYKLSFILNIILQESCKTLISTWCRISLRVVTRGQSHLRCTSNSLFHSR